MKRGITITNYLVSGDPEGIIFSSMSNWTGQAIKIPRNLFTIAKDFPELKKPGVYFLIGQDENNPDDKMIYAGEGNNLAERLATQLRTADKSFCEVIVCFSSKDENLTVSHTKYLEDKIISRLFESKEFRPTNGKSGNAINLPQMVKDEMDTFYDNIRIILPALGFDVLRNSQNQIQEIDSTAKGTLFLDVSTFKAEGKLTSTGVIVSKGSSMNPKETPSLSGSYSNMRKTLLDKGIVTLKSEKLEFVEEYEFASPSTAASIILGYSINGRTAWRYKNGKTLKQMEEEKLD